MPSHQVIDQRSVAFGRAIAAKLEAHPELIARAQATLTRWMTTATPNVVPALEEWSQVLHGPLAGVIDLLTNPDERSTRLRQSNPFTGALSPAERNAILRQFQSHDAHST